MSDIEHVGAGHGDLVVVGSSAGGVEALSLLVSTLPADFPAPIVLAQHLDPSRFSNLGHILERQSTLPIVVLESRAALQSGIVYVVPANRHVSIHDGYVILEGDHPARIRPSVDLLLSTAAAAYEERLIAVILTGSGSDGAAGAVDVKQAGGTVVIQNPETAHYPSMPMSLPPTAVDYVVDLPDLGPLLYDIIKGVALPEMPELTGNTLNIVLEHVSQRTNINFRSYKPSTLVRRIARRMAVNHIATMDDYATYLEAHPKRSVSW